MSKRQIRAEFVALYVRSEPAPYDVTGHDWLLRLVASAEREGAEQVAHDLIRGAWRREELHDDWGSGAQMRFAADVLLAHGARGLLF
jgi:hypothetical protein